jgi:hypothetical protein
MTRLAGFVLALGACLAGGAVHPLTNMPDALENIETNYYFPDHEDLKLPIGEPLVVLCHIQNNADVPVNLTAVMGSLNVAYMFSQHVQNYSYKPFGVMIKADEEITLQYEFELHSQLDPSQEYTLAHTVFYETAAGEGKSSKRRFSTTFFNQSVEIYSSESDYGAGTLLELLGALVSTFCVALAVVAVCLPDNKHVKTGIAYLSSNFGSLGKSGTFSGKDGKDD